MEENCTCHAVNFGDKKYAFDVRANKMIQIYSVSLSKIIRIEAIKARN